MNTIRTLFLSFVALISVTTAYANDGVYYTSGSLLIPAKETNISVAKEILTITIGKGDYASVDVYYEFYNNDAAKKVLMGFEAASPYPGGDEPILSGGHPNIKDFTVMMNNSPLKYTNGIVKVDYSDGIPSFDLTPLDRSQWKFYGEVPDSILPEDGIYNIVTKEFSSYAYAYYFDAPFQAGKNIVHHTYKYQMSASVMNTYEIPYWLTPATRWANHKIDDFTLRIKNERGDEFFLQDSLFINAPFKIVGNAGELYRIKARDDVHYAFCCMPPASTLEWHIKDFCPDKDLYINSLSSMMEGYSAPFETGSYNYEADVIVNKEGYSEAFYMGSDGDKYFVLSQDFGMVDKGDYKIEHRTAANGQGWVMPKNLGKTINVRQKPSVKSPAVGKLTFSEGELPDVYDCLGMAKSIDENDWNDWFYINIHGKKGYVRADLVDWTAVLTF